MKKPNEPKSLLTSVLFCLPQKLYQGCRSVARITKQTQISVFYTENSDGELAEPKDRMSMKVEKTKQSQFQSGRSVPASCYFYPPLADSLFAWMLFCKTNPNVKPILLNELYPPVGWVNQIQNNPELLMR